MYGDSVETEMKLALVPVSQALERMHLSGFKLLTITARADVALICQAQVGTYGIALEVPRRRNIQIFLPAVQRDPFLARSSRSRNVINKCQGLRNIIVLQTNNHRSRKEPREKRVSIRQNGTGESR